MANKDALGDRMKEYEKNSRTSLLRRLPVVMRLDGKAFHTFTRAFDRPYDQRLHNAMWEAARTLCDEIQGCRLAYVQSDEITLLLTDWDSYATDSWFDYQVQKMASVAASICTGGFIRGIARQSPGTHGFLTGKLPAFDARVWNLPRHEVTNMFIWRQQDAIRNSISSLGQAHFSAKQLHRQSTQRVREMLVEAGHPWENTPIKQQRGVCVVKETHTTDAEAVRTRWVVDEEIPVFTEDRDYIERHLPEVFWREGARNVSSGDSVA